MARDTLSSWVLRSQLLPAFVNAKRELTILNASLIGAITPSSAGFKHCFNSRIDTVLMSNRTSANLLSYVPSRLKIGDYLSTLVLQDQILCTLNGSSHSGQLTSIIAQPEPKITICGIEFAEIEVEV